MTPMTPTRHIERAEPAQTPLRTIYFACVGTPGPRLEAHYVLHVERLKPKRKRPAVRQYGLCERHARHYAAKYGIPLPEEGGRP
jgi:hypothetical protein